MRRLLLAALLASVGCGPIQYITDVSLEASRAVAAARAARAAELAPYELTAATEYLHMARELGGASRWQEAQQYGQRATAMARQALVVAREHAEQPRSERGE